MLGRAVDEAKKVAAMLIDKESPVQDGDMSSSLQDFSEQDIIAQPGQANTGANEKRQEVPQKESRHNQDLL